MEEKEAKIRKITHLYYSNPKVQEALLKFAQNREVVPRYFDGFGRRPDTLQYNSDIMGLVKKGATSFHASEEIWHDALKIDSNMRPDELNDLRKSWDLVIDIDPNYKYLDLSKLLTLLIIKALENHGVNNYKIKFSGNKGFHIIVSGKAFPSTVDGKKMNEMFPEWPRAICEYLMHYVKREYNKGVLGIMGNVETIKKVTSLTEKEFLESACPKCGRPAKKGALISLKCPDCNFSIQRKDMKLTKRKLYCPQGTCTGLLEVIEEKDYFQCENCDGLSSIDKTETSGKYKATYTKEASKSRQYAEEFEEEVSGEKFGSSDLVLVAPRHLFRMPYSLHEKTAFASVVLEKNEIENFHPPRDADPLRVNIRDFLPQNFENEGEKLLLNAIKWKKENMREEDTALKKKYTNTGKIDVSGVSEDMFPKPIKKLLKGLKDGRKRGLFVLITFLRSLNFSGEYINEKIRIWNALNDPPLKEGYVKSQIEWHLKQRKQILPPNYTNNNFYKDLGLLDEKPKVKNPIVEVLRLARK
ncbi:MAG: hypothetical protein Q7S27_02035 [Nanoarchaeota archaeon]|nr:hypothetical protein [Nanoarchaeota archaeon]